MTRENLNHITKAMNLTKKAADRNTFADAFMLMLVVATLLLIGLSQVSSAYAATNITIYSSKSGWITEKNNTASFANSKTNNQTLQYFGSNGKKAFLSSVQYEWFNLSSIPANATIISAKMYKYTASDRMGADWNTLMNPQVMPNASRVSIGKLLEPFNSNDTFRNVKFLFKKQLMLNRTDLTSTLKNDRTLEFNVTDVVQKWVKGEVNYGFSFLGNFNIRGDTATRYYFSNASQQYRPNIVIEYTIPSCGNGVIDISMSEQCDDGNNASNDGCSSSCKRESCGDNILQSNESCELPNTVNNQFCAQSNLTCSGNNRTAIRDNFGNCGSSCGCQQDAVNYQCIKGSCSASCAVNSDCNDDNPNTIDTCDLNSCGCSNAYQAQCGNGILDISLNETCELPFTPNNPFCAQSNSSCSGNMTGIRDNFGNCGSTCGCMADVFSYQCKAGSCGATCAVNADCNDFNSTTIDSCDIASCSCKFVYQPVCGNGVIDPILGETCEIPNSINNEFCQQANMTCSGNNRTAVRDNFGNCGSTCGCQQDPVNYQCVKGSCRATCSLDADCNDSNPLTTDICDQNSCGCMNIYQAQCGNGVVDLNLNESCELPGTSDNSLCTQSTSSCNGNKTGTRDTFGNCDAQCGCVLDSFVFQCLSGSCGATCASNEECGISQCSSSYQDLCNGTKLVDYNNNNLQDIALVNASCDNSCSNSTCGCNACTPICNAPTPVTKCVVNSCGATCSVDSDCNDNNANTSDSCDANSCGCIFTSIPRCGDGIINNDEQCDDGNILEGDGCSPICNIESENITYVVPYIGDIDGAVASTWFHFYEELADFLDSNSINSTISFFPGTMDDDTTYKNALVKMYNSRYIELIQKGYDGGPDEFIMETLSYSRQKEIITSGQNAFKTKMKSYLGIENIKPLRTYDQIGSRVNAITQQVLEDMGYFCYFDVYYAPDLTPLQPSQKLDVIQYGVGFSDSNAPSKFSNFRNATAIIRDIKNYSRNDVPIMQINGTKVVPVWIHHQDFESIGINGVVNSTKWSIFTDVLLQLKNDPDVILITADQLYRLTHLVNDSEINVTPNVTIGNVCEYATSATATSENTLGSLAAYATGRPDTTDANCQLWSGYGRSWSPSNWNVAANLTLNYATEIEVNNLTIIGDYDTCINGVWLKNQESGDTVRILDAISNDCTMKLNYNGNFSADSIIIQTCGWAWSSTDAVELCGQALVTDGNDTNNTGAIGAEVCLWEGCKSGAVSVSVDDGFDACVDELNANGLRGTYYLSETDGYSSSKWQTFDDMFKRGHEIGTHTQSHFCYELSAPVFYDEVENNIQDITTHTSVTRNDLVTHAYPCGTYSPTYKTQLTSNWNFLAGRGYNFNAPDYSTPQEMYNLKSLNSHDYPGGSLEPPNYFTAVDNAAANGDWLNLVFHIDCSDDGIINYLGSNSDVWTDTVGNVAKYIRLRDSAVISNFTNTTQEINFKVTSSLTQAYYRHNLTMKVDLPSSPASVKVDGNNTNFIYVNDAEGKYIIFDVQFPINDNVRIVLV